MSDALSILGGGALALLLAAGYSLTRRHTGLRQTRVGRAFAGSFVVVSLLVLCAVTLVTSEVTGRLLTDGIDKFSSTYVFGAMGYMAVTVVYDIVDWAPWRASRKERVS